MSNFNTLNEVLKPKNEDFTLIRQDGVDVKIKRSNTFANISDILSGTGNNTSISPENLLKFFISIQIGEIKYTQSTTPAPLHVRALGQELNRVKYKDLFNFASTNNLIISQSLKNTQPFENGAKYGDGDGSTTFTLPNYHQGQVLRGASSLGSFGTTQGDAIRNIAASATLNEGRSTIYQVAGETEGAFTSITSSAGTQMQRAESSTTWGAGLKFDASLVVPTANENRMKNSNIYIDIFTGVIA